MFKVWFSLCFSKTVHHIAFKLGIGINKICICLYYSMGSHWFEFFLWNHGNYGSIYLCSHLAVKLKFLCWDYLSETIGLCTVKRRDVLWNGPVRLYPSIHLSVSVSVCPQLLLKMISLKPLIWILLRPGSYLFGSFYENQDGRYSSLKINIVSYAGYCLWMRKLENRLSDCLHILIWPFYQ